MKKYTDPFMGARNKQGMRKDCVEGSSPEITMGHVHQHPPHGPDHDPAIG